MSAGLMTGIMVMPTVASISLDSLQSIPRSLREGAYAIGVTTLEVITKVIFPAALSGIAASILLGISRAIGETMIVVIAAGQQFQLSINPLQTLETMTAYMAQISGGDSARGSLKYKTLYAVGAVLFLNTLALNIVTHQIANR